MEFGKKLREARKQAGLSQAALAEAAGITARSVQYYESGQRQPQPSAVIALARALELPVSALTDQEILEAPGRAVLRDEIQRQRTEDHRQELNRLLSTTAELMFSGELKTPEELAFMRAVNDIYFDARQKSGVPVKEYRIEDYLD